eukprot:GHVO01019108.1.p1 GENE.GHVO01019108.1~~GHVO01019108.1.p1  ORF type:complete len:228 (+),score=33.17 GHVO01019108.1:3-686(+)
MLRKAGVNFSEEHAGKTLEKIVGGMFDTEKFPVEEMNDQRDMEKTMDSVVKIDKEDDKDTEENRDLDEEDLLRDGSTTTIGDLSVFTWRRKFTLPNISPTKVENDVTPANRVLPVPCSLKGIVILISCAATLLCFVLVLIAVLCFKRMPRREYVDVENDDFMHSSFSDDEESEIDTRCISSTSSDDTIDCTDYATMDNSVDFNMDTEMDNGQSCSEMESEYWIDNMY